MPSARQATGATAETAACEFLEAAGLTVLRRNYSRRSGELDIVAQQGDVLIVAEVRLRASEAFGGAAGSIDWHKRARLIRTTQQLLQQNRDWAKLRVRFDAVLLRPAGQRYHIEWIKHAFSA